jgi:RNA polymerase sigma-70 factor (ECF subfamily)
MDKAMELATKTWDEQELLRRMLSREEEAWKEFHLRYDRLIFRCIHKVTGRFSNVVGPEDVREIFATLLLQLNAREMHKLRTFAPERGNKLSSWIGLLATNAAWDHLRGIARQPAYTSISDVELVGEEQSDPYERLLDKQRWERVNQTLRGFSAKDREFVQLYYVDGLSPEQVAEEMQISVKTVYSKKHKIRCRLERELGPIVAAAA